MSESPNRLRLWKDPIAAQAFRRDLCWHVVALVVVVRVEGVVRHGVYSGFFLVHGDRLGWVTAAHCMEEELMPLAARDDVEWLGAWWHDHYPASNIEAVRIPVDVRSLVEGCVFGDGDVAVAAPGQNQVELLLSNPQFRPLTSIAVGDFDDYPDDGLLVVGFPSSWRREWAGEDAESVTHYVRADAACLPATVLGESERGTGSFWEHAECVYAKVGLPDARPVFELGSIKGMSGGPVFGMREQGADRVLYAPVGLQSAWLPDSLVIRVEPLSRVVQLMTDEGAESAE